MTKNWFAIATLAFSCSVNAQSNMQASVADDYEGHLAALFDHFHRNPELSLAEHQTAARMADELRAAGFDVTEGIGGTGVVTVGSFYAGTKHNSEESVPPVTNSAALARRLKVAWAEQIGEEEVIDNPTKGMGAEDFPFFSVDPSITSVFRAIGGTPQEAFDAEAAGGPPVPSHHSPLFKISPEPSVRRGVESTVVALMTLLGV